MRFTYEVPTSLEEAVALMEKYGTEAKILAGGTDLVIQLQEEKVRPKVIVDITRIEELKTLELRQDSLIIGSLCTFSEIALSPKVNKYATALARAAATVGSPQIRNQGTLGGNLANASPAADSIPALLCLESKVGVISSFGANEVNLEDLLGGVGFTNLKPNEIITYFRIPVKKDFYSSYAKLGRRNALAIARISIGLAVVLEGGKIREVAVALGAVGPTAYRVPSIEQLLVGREPMEKVWPDVEEQLGIEVGNKIAGRVSVPYKREAVKGVVQEAWEQLFRSISGSKVSGRLPGNGGEASGI